MYREQMIIVSIRMIFQSQARDGLQQTVVSITGQLPPTELGEEDGDLETSMAQRYLTDVIQLAHRSARILGSRKNDLSDCLEANSDAG